MRWSEPVVLAACAVAALVVSMACTAWAIAYARRCGMLDQPGERRSHATATPRGGGVGIAVALLLAMCLLGGWVDAGWWPIAGGLLLVAGVGWGDDHRPLPIALRLGAHALAGVALAWGLHLQDAGLPAVLAALVLVPVLVNAWNFMDGINGLAASQALLCATGFAVVLGDGWRLLALVLAAACLGFLPFNFPRARVFLGDVGSGGLGYLVAALLAAGFAARPMAWWPLLLLPPLAMLADTGLTLLWRIRRRERWWQAHVQHAFQRWSRHRGHAWVCAAYAVWTFAAVALMLAALHWPARIALVVALATLPASAWAWRWLHRRYQKNNTEGFGT